MRRIILLALFFMVLAVSLSGCKRNVPPPAPVPEKRQADDLQKLLRHLKERLDRIEVQQSKLARQVEELEAKPISPSA